MYQSSGIFIINWSAASLLYLYGGAEVVEAPGDDDVVVAAHQSSHHSGAIAHTTQSRVDLGQSRWS